MSNPLMSMKIQEANVFPSKDTLLKLTALTLPMSSCLAVGTTRKGRLMTSEGDFELDIHYNLYKESVDGFAGQRQNLLNLMSAYDVECFVSTALFHGTSDVVYANKNGLRILGAGTGKTAYKKVNYNRFSRENQLHADGIICEPGSGIVPVAYSADCVTGVMSAPNGAYGVFHSMARKLCDEDDNIILSMVRAFGNLWGVEPEDIQIAFYPSVSPSVYEVDQEFADAFPARYVMYEPGKKPRLMLEDLAISLARRYGVTQIAVSDHATAWGGLESLRGTEHSLLASGTQVGNSNGQNIVFAVPQDVVRL